MPRRAFWRVCWRAICGRATEGAERGANRQDIDNLINNLVKINGANVQVIDQTGTVVSTTEDKSTIGQRTSQPEVTVALLGTRSESMRIDPRTGARVKVLVLPVKATRSSMAQST